MVAKNSSESRNRLLDKVSNPAGLPQSKVREAQAILDKATGADLDPLPAGELLSVPLLVPVGLPDQVTGEYHRGLIVPEMVTGMREKNATTMKVQSQEAVIAQTEVLLAGGGAIVVAWTIDELFDALWPGEEPEPEPEPEGAKT